MLNSRSPVRMHESLCKGKESLYLTFSRYKNPKKMVMERIESEKHCWIIVVPVITDEDGFE